MKNEFRPLNNREREVFEKLLSVTFPGSQELMKQLTGMVVSTIDQNGSLACYCSEAQGAITDKRIPVEAECDDRDGVRVHILLHVVNGLINELEVFREDGETLIGTIEPNDMTVLVLP
jgi:hypothetical protein